MENLLNSFNMFKTHFNITEYIDLNFIANNGQLCAQGVLNFELGTEVRPEVSTTTL